MNFAAKKLPDTKNSLWPTPFRLVVADEQTQFKPSLSTDNGPEFSDASFQKLCKIAAPIIFVEAGNQLLCRLTKEKPIINNRHIQRTGIATDTISWALCRSHFFLKKNARMIDNLFIAAAREANSPDVDPSTFAKQFVTIARECAKEHPAPMFIKAAHPFSEIVRNTCCPGFTIFYPILHSARVLSSMINSDIGYNIPVADVCGLANCIKTYADLGRPTDVVKAPDSPAPKSAGSRAFSLVR